MAVSEFERRAWDSRTNADRHPPEMAIKIALDDIERGIVKPIHAIVVFVEEDGATQHVSYLQAGSLTDFAVDGALLRATRLSSE